ncbi:hypothetical protein F5H01DRAFT_342305, partial [Linnemannia elongata]
MHENTHTQTNKTKQDNEEASCFFVSPVFVSCPPYPYPCPLIFVVQSINQPLEGQGGRGIKYHSSRIIHHPPSYINIYHQNNFLGTGACALICMPCHFAFHSSWYNRQGRRKEGMWFIL